MTIKVTLLATDTSVPTDNSRGNQQTKLPRITGDGRSGFDLSIRGLTANGSGTVTLQRSFDGGNAWGNVQAYTADAEQSGFAFVKAEYRVIFSGTVAAANSITIIVS